MLGTAGARGFGKDVGDDEVLADEDEVKSTGRIRSAVLEDLPAVLALERSTAEAPHWDAAMYREAVLAEALRDGEQGRHGRERRLIVAVGHDVSARSGERLTGFATGQVVTPRTTADGILDTPIEPWGELETIAVAPELRRRGVGRALCEAMLGWMNEAGAVHVELEVRASSAGAIALYRSLGFVEQGRRRGYYASPTDDAVLMATRAIGGKWA